jgi:hypothetical protein
MFINTYPADYLALQPRKEEASCSLQFVVGIHNYVYFLYVIYGSVTCVHIYRIAVYLQAHRTSADMSSSSLQALVVTWQ